MKKIKLIINNDLKKDKEKFFVKKELQSILNLYAKMVSNGTWKDYSLSSGSKAITESPPPLIKCLSTPGGSDLSPGSLISMLVKILSIYSNTISDPISTQCSLTREK